MCLSVASLVCPVRRTLAKPEDFVELEQFNRLNSEEQKSTEQTVNS